MKQYVEELETNINKIEKSINNIEEPTQDILFSYIRVRKNK